MDTVGVQNAIVFALGAHGRPTFDEYGLAIAEAVSLRADCRRSKVGAVILDINHVVVATGYNGTKISGTPGCLDGACPRGLLSHDEAPPGWGYAETGCTAIHAEANALRWAERAGQQHRVTGSTLYVTRQPCPGCATLISEHYVARAVWPEGEWVV